jgi:hypothetical protein
MAEKKTFKETPIADRYAMAVYNEALKYLDPTSRGQIMRLMSQRLPKGFADYAQAGTPQPLGPGAAGAEYQAAVLSPERLGQAIQALSPTSVFSALKGGRKVAPHKEGDVKRHIAQKTGGGLNWLNDYLRTAQQAYGTGAQRMSRAQRTYAQQRLGELGEGAQQGGIGARYIDLAKALVDPVLHKAPTSGGLGTQRAVGTPGGKPKRGGSFAAGELT